MIRRLVADRILLALAKCFKAQGKFRVALEHSQEAEKSARSAERHDLVAKSLIRQGWSRYRLGEQEQVLQLGEEALELASRHKEQHAVGESLRLLGAGHLALGHHDEASRCAQRSLLVFRDEADHRAIAAGLDLMGEVARHRGDHRVAAMYSEQGLDAFRKVGDRFGELNSLNNLGAARIGMGDMAGAKPLLLQVIEDDASGWMLAETYRLLATACLEQTQMEEALDAAQQSVARSIEIDAAEFTGPALRVLGEVLARLDVTVSVRGSDTDALSCFKESLDILVQADMDAERARTLRAWARYEHARGNQTGAEQMWDEARTLFTDLHLDGELERMTAL